MGQVVAVFLLALGKGREELGDVLAEINGQNQDRAELDDDGIHLPVAALQRHVQQDFGNAEMGGGTDGQELGESFDNSQQHGQKIVVQVSSPLNVEMRRAASLRKFIWIQGASF